MTSNIFSRILVIYPMEHSTKIALYKNVTLIFLKNIRHKKEELKNFRTVVDQEEYRAAAIIRELQENDIDPAGIDLVIARGGLTKAVNSGVYLVNEAMKADLRAGVQGMHAVNLGGLLADRVIKVLPNAKACIADPAVVDELDDVARVTGHPMFQRKSIFHALNQKYMARRYARSINTPYESLSLIVAHLGGGGISIGAHKNGFVVDVNQAFDGDGPFAITRSGTLPAGELVKLCFSGKYTEQEIMQLITSEGGLYAYLGTDNIDEIEKKINSDDDHARFIAYAMAYQVAREIGAMYTVLEKVDAIILSGELFHSTYFTECLTKRIEKIAPISLYATVNDMDALVSNAVMLLNGETEAMEYL